MTRPKLLLVEDDELVRLVTADLLTEMGYSVREAEGAGDALAALDAPREPRLRARLHARLGAMLEEAGLEQPLRFAPYRMGSAFLRAAG